MTNHDDYDNVLNRTWDEIPVEKTLPDGRYILKGRNAAFLPPKNNANARVLVFYTVAEPLEVDQSDLDSLGPDYDMTENEVVKQFWVERNRDWRAVREHLELLGIDLTGKSQLDSLKEVQGKTIAAALTTESFTDGNGKNREQNKATEFFAIE